MSPDRYQFFAFDLTLGAVDAAKMRQAKVLAFASALVLGFGWILHLAGGNSALVIALGALSLTAVLMGARTVLVYAAQCASVAADVLRLRSAPTRALAFPNGKIWFVSTFLDLILRPPSCTLHV